MGEFSPNFFHPTFYSLNKMKKIIIGFLAIITLVFGTIWLLNHNAKFFYPKMTLSILQINSLGDDEAQLNINVNLKNRSPFSMDFDDFNFRITAKDKILAQTDTVIPISLKRFKSSNFKVPFKIQLADIKRIAAEMDKAGKDSCWYSFDLEIINKKTLFLPDTIFIQSKEKLPTYHVPEVKLARMEPIKIRAEGGPKFRLHLTIDNKNLFPIEIKSPSYAVTFEGDDVLLQGNYPKTLFVPGKTSLAVPIAVQMDKKTILAHAGKLLFKKDELDVALIFKGDLVTNSKFIDGCTLVIKVNGDFKELTNRDR